MKYYKVPEVYFECLIKMSHKYQALREAYCLDENEAVDKYVKSYIGSSLEEYAAFDDLVSSSIAQYENEYGVI